MTKKVNAFDFINTSLEKAGVKFALGLTLTGKKYLKVKFFDLKLFEKSVGLGIGLVGGDNPEVGILLGVNLKKKFITLDVGLRSPLKDLDAIKNIKPRLFAGISFSFNG